MLFDPKILQEHEGSFDIPRNTCVVAHSCMNKDVIKEFKLKNGNAVVPSTDARAIEEIKKVVSEKTAKTEWA